jgi:pimeloyl-ACP methyl ester carboxylesterase
VSGEGPLEVVFNNASGVPIDLMLEDPGFLRLRRRLDPFSRTVWFDARGVGASEGDISDYYRGDSFDPDLTALIDAVGFQRPALVAEGGSGGVAIRLVGTHAERVSALVLVNSYAHYVQEPDYPWGRPSESLDRFVADVKERWGTGALVEVVAPSRIGDERFRVWLARSARFGLGPDHMAELLRADVEADVRPVLPSISAPTLVLHREGDRYIRLGAGRWLAEHTPNAKFVVLPGDDHLFFVGDTDALVDEIEEFLNGTRSGAEADVRTMTVVFTDTVGSTEQQARVGEGSGPG